MASTWTFTSSLCSSDGNTKPSYATPEPEEHELLPWNQAHVHCSSIPLFGQNGSVFVHENRTEPSKEFDDNCWLTQALHIISGTSHICFWLFVVWPFSCCLRAALACVHIWYSDCHDFILLEECGTCLLSIHELALACVHACWILHV